MALFHKDFHKLLAEHIKQLGKFGELPEMWVWHHDKVIELKEIDEALIEDLNALPSELGESPEALELLKKLQEDLERMLKQRPVADVQKREAKAVNSLIVNINNVMSKILEHGEINEFFREHRPHLALNIFSENFLVFLSKNWDITERFIEDVNQLGAYNEFLDFMGICEKNIKTRKDLVFVGEKLIALFKQYHEEILGIGMAGIYAQLWGFYKSYAELLKQYSLDDFVDFLEFCCSYKKSFDEKYKSSHFSFYDASLSTILKCFESSDIKRFSIFKEKVLILNEFLRREEFRVSDSLEELLASGKITIDDLKKASKEDVEEWIIKYKIKKRLGRDPSDWDLNDLIAVRADYEMCLNKLIERKHSQKILFASPFRPSIHFSLNHLVVSHVYGSWDDCNIAFLIPFKDLFELNKLNFVGGSTVDIFFIGFVKLPNSTRIVKRKLGETLAHFKSRINNEIVDMGFYVMPGGQRIWGGDVGELHDSINKFWWRMSKNYGFKYCDHADSDFGIAEQCSRRFTSDDARRKVIIDEYETNYPDLFRKYRHILRLWNDFWVRKSSKEVNKVIEELKLYKSG